MLNFLKRPWCALFAVVVSAWRFIMPDASACVLYGLWLSFRSEHVLYLKRDGSRLARRR